MCFSSVTAAEQIRNNQLADGRKRDDQSGGAGRPREGDREYRCRCRARCGWKSSPRWRLSGVFDDRQAKTRYHPFPASGPCRRDRSVRSDAGMCSRGMPSPSSVTETRANSIGHGAAVTRTLLPAPPYLIAFSIRFWKELGELVLMPDDRCVEGLEIELNGDDRCRWPGGASRSATVPMTCLQRDVFVGRRVLVHFNARQGQQVVDDPRHAVGLVLHQVEKPVLRIGIPTGRAAKGFDESDQRREGGCAARG